MTNINEHFFRAFWKPGMKSVFTAKVPKEMMLSPIYEDGSYEWKLLEGTLTIEDYKKIETKFKVKFPLSFIEWHKKYYFADCDCSIVILPDSFPTKPMEKVISNLDNFTAERLIQHGLIPFADAGNDAGPLVFDTRNQIDNTDFPVRPYEHEYCGDLAGLGDIIFSSFTKMLECLTYYLEETQTRNSFEVVSEFYEIDPEGAGSTGRDFWSIWTDVEEDKP